MVDGEKRYAAIFSFKIFCNNEKEANTSRHLKCAWVMLYILLKQIINEINSVSTLLKTNIFNSNNYIMLIEDFVFAKSITK